MPTGRIRWSLTWGLCLGALLPAALPKPAAGEDSPKWWKDHAAVYDLSGPTASYLVASRYPAQELRLDLILTCRQPGVALDTCGIGAAAPGSLTLIVLDDRRLSLSLYDPERGSAVNPEGGWHQLLSDTPLAPDQPYWVNLALHDGHLAFWIDEQLQADLELATPLSGEALYAGDCPLDDHFGGPGIHPAMLGVVEVAYCGPYAPTIDARNIGQTLAQPGAPLSSWNRAGAWDAPARHFGAGGGAAPESGAASGSGSPEASVEALVRAQAAQDLEAQLEQLALERFDPAAQRATRYFLEQVGRTCKIQNLRYTTRGVMYSEDGHTALVRYATAATYSTVEGSEEAAFGGLAWLNQLDGRWKIVFLVPDDLLNMEFIQREEQGAPGGEHQINYMKVAAALGPRSEMVNYQDLNAQLDKTMFSVRINTKKLPYDETFSLIGLFPFGGDIIAGGYTAVDMLQNTLYDLLPDAYNGDLEMVILDLVQLQAGATSILCEPVPGLDVATDQAYQVFDQLRWTMSQQRAYTRLRQAVRMAELGDFPKYLLLRPGQAAHIPATELDNNPPVSLEYYEDWPGQRPIKSITFLSDKPLAEWKVLNFDIATRFEILESENLALFESAKKLGIRPKLREGIVADSLVSIPVRLAGHSVRGSMVSGELPASEFERIALQGGLPPDKPIEIDDLGAAVLQNARLVTGLTAAERFLRLDITSTPGPVQYIRVPLGDGSTTELLKVYNAVFNDLAGLERMESSGEMWFDAPIEIGSADFQPLEGTDSAIALVYTAHHDSLPGPRVIGLENLEFTVPDPSMITVSVTGQYPQARLEVTGLKVGTTELQYRLLTGDARGVRTVERYLTVEVKSVGGLEKVSIEVSTPIDPDVIIPPPPE